MWGYIIKRFLYMIGILLIVSFISFIVLQSIPIDLSNISDPLRREEIKQQYGLDAPPWIQYIKWLSSIGQGKFGLYIWSSGSTSDVSDMLFGKCLIGERCHLANTLFLALATLFFAWSTGILLGIYSATHLGMIRERNFALLGYLFSGLPHFLFAFLLSVLGYELFNRGWSAGKSYSAFIQYFPLYILMIGAANIAFVMRHMRSSLLDVLDEDYVRTARSQGFGERFIVYKRALKNALNPLISMFGFSIPALFEGTLVIAYIYRLPIVELQYWNAFGQKGQPYVVASGLLLFSFLLLLGNFVSDLLLLWSDPRIRYR